MFPDGKELLAGAIGNDSSGFSVLRVNLSTHTVADLGKISGEDPTWGEPGKTVFFSKTVNGLTNLWSHDLRLNQTQITFGPGPDFSPMPDPGGKGIYFVNGKSSGLLTVYHVHSKTSTDISSENATQPVFSLDGKRVMYIERPGLGRSELWVSDLDGVKKLKLASGKLGTGTWAPDNQHISFHDESGASSKV